MNELWDEILSIFYLLKHFSYELEDVASHRILVSVLISLVTCLQGFQSLEEHRIPWNEIFNITSLK